MIKLLIFTFNIINHWHEIYLCCKVFDSNVIFGVWSSIITTFAGTGLKSKRGLFNEFVGLCLSFDPTIIVPFIDVNNSVFTPLSSVVGDIWFTFRFVYGIFVLTVVVLRGNCGTDFV